jgi:hypothetical protein
MINCPDEPLTLATGERGNFALEESFSPCGLKINALRDGNKG